MEKRVEMMRDNLKAIRIISGWTQADLAKKLDISRATVCSYEAKRTILPLTTYYAIQHVVCTNNNIWAYGMAKLVDRCDPTVYELKNRIEEEASKFTRRMGMTEIAMYVIKKTYQQMMSTFEGKW